MLARIAAASILACAPAFALAACPVAADLTNGGIEVVYEDGATSLFLSERPGYVIEEVRFDESGDGFWTESWLGAYQVAVSDIKGGERLRDGGSFAEFSVPLADIPKPAPGLRWDDYYRELDETGAELGKRDIVHFFGGEQRYSIGECSYPAMRLGVLTLMPGDNSVGRFVYLRDLGISVVIAEGVQKDDNSTELDKYEPVSIAKAQAR